MMIPEPAAAIRILVVEDDPVLREDLLGRLQEVAGFELTGVAATLEAGRTLIGRPFDVLLVDIALPDGSGLDLIRAARATPAAAGAKIIVISIFGDARTVVLAIEAGADGYLLKTADVKQAEQAIRTVLEGGAPISPAVASHILARLRRSKEAPAPSDEPPLTDKEAAVLADLAKGFRIKEVARIHGISPHTVAFHVKSIYRKLAVNSRSEAVFEAVQAGLLQIRD